MPDNLSPEERLLRLIKGDTSSSSSAKPNSNPAKPNPAPSKKPADTVSKSVSKPDKAKPKPEKSVSDISKRIVSDPPADPASPSGSPASVPESSVKRVKDTAEPPVQADKKSSGTSKLPSKKRVVLKTTSSHKAVKPSVTSAIPVSNPSSEERKKTARPFAGIVWFLSGFNLFNILLLIIVIALIVLEFYFMPDKPVVQSYILKNNIAVSDSNSSPEEFEEPLPKPFPYYISVLGAKSLFKVIKPPAPPKPKYVEKKPEKPKIKIETLTRHLVLQGIVYDIGPPQAIIFDKKANKTLFLGNGDKVTDQIKIKEIHRGKIILEYEDQTQELSF